MIQNGGDFTATKAADSTLISSGVVLMTRAASLSYGVLEELARTEIEIHGTKRRLLDEVDMISSVSGGSFTAAYYALFGDRIFEYFEGCFLIFYA